MVARFRREGVAASRLTHPSSVKVYNFGETDDGVLWLAMELLEGVTLDQFLLRRKKLSHSELLSILRPICELLEEAHQKGIVHRDLKPENIMILTSPRLTAKVLDFGLASLLESDDHATQTGMVSGTPRYMSPEQWKGLKYTDHRADLYALGVLIYQCLAGRLPFEADTGPAWMQKHCLEAPLDLEIASDHSVSAPVKHAVMRSLAKDPAHRYQSAMALYHSIEEALAKKAPASVTVVQSPRPALSGAATTPSFAAGVAAVQAPPEKSRGFSLQLSLGTFKIALSLAFVVVGGVVILPLLREPAFAPAHSEAVLLAEPTPAPAAAPSSVAAPIDPSQATQEPRSVSGGGEKRSSNAESSAAQSEPPKLMSLLADEFTPQQNDKQSSDNANNTGTTEASLKRQVNDIASKCFSQNSLPTKPLPISYTGKMVVSAAGKITAIAVSPKAPLIKGAIEQCMRSKIQALKLSPTKSGKELTLHF